MPVVKNDCSVSFVAFYVPSVVSVDGCGRGNGVATGNEAPKKVAVTNTDLSGTCSRRDSDDARSDRKTVTAADGADDHHSDESSIERTDTTNHAHR